MCGDVETCFCAKNERVIGGKREVAPFCNIKFCFGTGIEKKSYFGP